MTLVERIAHQISLAEQNDIPAEEFDSIFDKLSTEAQEESAPLLQSGQKNHAAILNSLLDGLKSLKPISKIEEPFVVGENRYKR